MSNDIPEGYRLVATSNEKEKPSRNARLGCAAVVLFFFLFAVVVGMISSVASKSDERLERAEEQHSGHVDTVAEVFGITKDEARAINSSTIEAYTKRLAEKKEFADTPSKRVDHAVVIGFLAFENELLEGNAEMVEESARMFMSGAIENIRNSSLDVDTPIDVLLLEIARSGYMQKHWGYNGTADEEITFDYYQIVRDLSRGDDSNYEINVDQIVKTLKEVQEN